MIRTAPGIIAVVEESPRLGEAPIWPKCAGGRMAGWGARIDVQLVADDGGFGIGYSMDARPMSEVNSEALDFRVASESL